MPIRRISSDYKKKITFKSNNEVMKQKKHETL